MYVKLAFVKPKNRVPDFLNKLKGCLNQRHRQALVLNKWGKDPVQNLRVSVH